MCLPSETSMCHNNNRHDPSLSFLYKTASRGLMFFGGVGAKTLYNLLVELYREVLQSSSD